MKNRNKAIIVASLVGAVNSYATCSVPSNGATAGSTVTCTGTTTGVYSINAANVTFLNQGDMTGTGRQFAMIISHPTTTTVYMLLIKELYHGIMRSMGEQGQEHGQQ